MFKGKKQQLLTIQENPKILWNRTFLLETLVIKLQEKKIIQHQLAQRSVITCLMELYQECVDISGWAGVLYEVRSREDKLSSLAD